MIGVLAVSFALGILAGTAAPRAALALMTVGAALAVGALLRRHRLLGAALLAWALGALAAWHALSPPRLPAAAAAAVAAGTPVAAEAVWVRTLEAPPGAGSGGRALIDLRRVSDSEVSLRAVLGVYRGQVIAEPGDRVRLRVRLATPDGLANPGRPDARRQARAQGIDLQAFCARAEDVERLSAGPRWGPRRLAARAHRAMAAAIDRVLPTPRAALLRALVLGERNAAGAEVEQGFKAAGAVHALSVSGLHLTAVAGLIFLLLRQILLRVPGVALRARPSLLAAAAAVPLVVFYTLVTGEAVATVRAALMVSLALGAVLLRRRQALGNAIAAAALILLAGSPLLVLDASFQLSFVSVVALALAARVQSADGPGAGAWDRARRWVARALAATLAAGLVTAPLCAHHFAELTPAAPLGNLLLVPLIELALVPLGLLGAALGALVPALGWLPLQLAGLLAALVLWLAEGFRRWAPVVAVWSPTGLETAALTLALLLGVAAAGASAGRRRWLVAAAACLLAGSGSLAGRHLARRLDPGVTVSFLDVGQGDAVLIEGPRGFVALVDGGGSVDARGNEHVRFDPGARVIAPVLRRKTIGRLDLVVLSHPHPDHMNGLFAVLQGFPVGALWTNGDGGRNPAYDRLVALAQARGVRLAAPGVVDQGGLVIEPRGPWLGDRIGVAPGLDVNDASLVLALRFAGRGLLLTGDVEEQGEAELIGRARPGELRADVLKVPHHGSRTSSGEELLSAVSPRLAVASLARRNRFGFPHSEVATRYARLGIPLLRTDRDGAVVIEIDPAGNMQVTCARSWPVTRPGSINCSSGSKMQPGGIARR